MQATWLHPSRRLLCVVTTSGRVKSAFGRCSSCRVLGVCRCHAEDESTARALLLSEGVTTPVSSSDVCCVLVGVFAENGEQPAGCDQSCESLFVRNNVV